MKGDQCPIFLYKFQCQAIAFVVSMKRRYAFLILWEDIFLNFDEWQVLGDTSLLVELIYLVRNTNEIRIKSLLDHCDDQKKFVTYLPRGVYSHGPVRCVYNSCQSSIKMNCTFDISFQRMWFNFLLSLINSFPFKMR